MLKNYIIKRTFNLVILAFVLFAALISIYFYFSVKTQVDAVGTSIDIVGGAFSDAGILNSIRSSLSGIFGTFVSLIIVFVSAVVSLVFGLWFTANLYLIQRSNALIDPLTGLYNRKAISAAIDREIKRSKRFKHPTSLAVLDIDFFKKYNDTLGHVAGDRLLKRFAGIMKHELRDFDLIGRIGGEEFLILFPETELNKAAAASERLRKVIERTPFAGEGKLPHKKVTISVGVAEFSGNGNMVREKFVELADKRLYAAKESGRNKMISN